MDEQAQLELVIMLATSKAAHASRNGVEALVMVAQDCAKAYEAHAHDNLDNADYHTEMALDWIATARRYVDKIEELLVGYRKSLTTLVKDEYCLCYDY